MQIILLFALALSFLMACDVRDPEPEVARDEGDAGVWLDGTLALSTWPLCPLLGPTTANAP